MRFSNLCQQLLFRRIRPAKVKKMFVSCSRRVNFFQTEPAATLTIFFLFDQLQFHLKCDFSNIIFRFIVFRSSHRRCSVRKGVLRNFTKFTGKHLYQSLFFNIVAGLRHRCFPVIFAKFLRTPFLQNTFGRQMYGT